MTKSEVFKKAHALTKSTVRTGDSYSATFAICLKVVHAEAKLFQVVSTITMPVLDFMMSFHAKDGVVIAKGVRNGKKATFGVVEITSNGFATTSESGKQFKFSLDNESLAGLRTFCNCYKNSNRKLVVINTGLSMKQRRTLNISRPGDVLTAADCLADIVLEIIGTGTRGKLFVPQGAWYENTLKVFGDYNQAFYVYN